MDRQRRKTSLKKYKSRGQLNYILSPSPPSFMNSHRFCLLKHFCTDLFFFLSPFYFSLYILRGKERYTAIFTRMLTEGGHHLCKLSEIVTSSLPSLPSERKPHFYIIQRILLPTILTTMLALTPPSSHDWCFPVKTRFSLA